MRILMFLTLVLFSLNACAMSGSGGSTSMSFEASNLSNGDIRNVVCKWNEQYVLWDNHIQPGGGTGSSIHHNKKAKDFYWLVILTWENAQGKKFEKKFEFTKEMFPMKNFNDWKQFKKDLRQKKQTIVIQESYLL